MPISVNVTNTTDCKFCHDLKKIKTRLFFLWTLVSPKLSCYDPLFNHQDIYVDCRSSIRGRKKISMWFRWKMLVLFQFDRKNNWIIMYIISYFKYFLYVLVCGCVIGPFMESITQQRLKNIFRERKNLL